MVKIYDPGRVRQRRNFIANRIARSLGIPGSEVIKRWNNGLHYCRHHGWHNGNSLAELDKDKNRCAKCETDSQ